MVLDVQRVSGQNASDLTTKLQNFFVEHDIQLHELVDVKVLQDASGFHCLIFFEKAKERKETTTE